MARESGVLKSTLARRTMMGLALGAISVPMLGPTVFAQTEGKVKPPKYKPMGRGAPGGRIGGATRGTPPETLKMLALAPDHVAYAASATPVLYWYLSDPIDQARFTLKKADTVVATKDLAGGLSKGILAVNLADHGLTLEPETVYEWSVSLVTDQDKDISAVSRGLVAFRAPSSKIAKQVEKAKPGDLADVHASNGYWYDAVNAISQMIAQNPDTAAYKEARAELVEQAKLWDVADYDRGTTAQ